MVDILQLLVHAILKTRAKVLFVTDKPKCAILKLSTAFLQLDFMQKRLIINLPFFSYYIIDANGISERKRIPEITDVKNMEA